MCSLPFSRTAPVSRVACEGALADATTMVYFQTRSFAAVLFRRIATKNRKDAATQQSRELFMTLPQPQRTAIRAPLLESLAKEPITMVRNKIGDAVAEIARQYTDDGTSLTTAECH